jgi:putative oxidoreductase
MTIVRRLARPLLAAPLIQSGLDAARHPGPQVELTRPLLQQISAPLRLPDDPLVVVRSAGAVTAVAGVLLALGKLPRLSALAIVLAAPAVQTSQPFWKEKDPELRRAQRTTFVKNLGLLGGALLAAVDTEGRPGLAWRGRRAGHLAADVARDAGAATVIGVKDAQRSAKESARAARKAARKAQKKATRQAHRQAASAGKAAAKAAEKARQSLPG